MSIRSRFLIDEHVSFCFGGAGEEGAGAQVDTIAYCPPRTEHDVICTGSDKLKYVYIVANAE